MPEPAAPHCPPWLPSHLTGARTVPCGHWWDAVRVGAYDGRRALNHFGDHSGPVIADLADRTLTWLVPVGAAAGWRVPEVTALGAGRWLSVPPATGDGALVWCVCPPLARDGLTDPDALRDALREVFGVRFGTRRA